MENCPEKERDNLTGLDCVDWSDYFAKAKEKLNKPELIVNKPTLSANEISFISGNSVKPNHELFKDIIYETKEWIRDVSSVDFEDFSNAASKLEEFIVENIEAEEGWYHIPFKNYAILVYHTQDDNWILCRLVDKTENDDYAAFTDGVDIPEDFQRGYPFEFLEDKDVWRVMEKDSKSNMVLSSQQIEIVQNGFEFPLFLTGRAGSGKSTILQYVFAEEILSYHRNKDILDGELKKPVYLSYSSNLIDDAKKLCKTLFEKNSAYIKVIEGLNLNYKSDILPSFNDKFYVFKDLLCDCIESKYPGTVAEKFTKDKYVSFPLFNKLWNKQFGKTKDAAKKYGPSISWHVIRTYIKGWDTETYCTPQDYALIGEKNQSVTQDTFEDIYNVVWEKWYSKLDGYWDDQDLVRYCLENDCVDEQFSAVFCDESQDFTRIEIDFILESSSFAHRRIDINDFNKLPFVFAGDEFQTLNPTGFSWELLSSYFTERLCALTGVPKTKGLIPSPIELSENFRSTKQVVRLANRIQLLRASRFKEESTPQKPHFSNEGNAVYCISPSDKLVFEKLKEKKVVLIVPSDDGESVEDFISNSSLKDMITFDNGVPNDITILNPTQAKGLEYPNVAIFGFDTNGVNSNLSITNLLSWFDNPQTDLVKDIALKYQVSNAYVAVTRASSNLYILDDVTKKSFWAFAFNQADDTSLERDITTLRDKMIGSLSNAQRQSWNENDLGWIEYVEGIDIDDENLNYMRSDEHLNDMESRANALQDPRMMRQTAALYKSKGDKTGEARCKAKAYVFEDNYLQAAEMYKVAGEYENAIEYFWKELNSNPSLDVISQIAHLKDYSHSVKVNVCVRSNKPSLNDCKLALASILQEIRQNQDELACRYAWQYVANLYLNKLEKGKSDGLKAIPIIAEYCQKLNALDFDLDVSRLARFAYDFDEFAMAAEIWETIPKDKRPSEYYSAMLKITKYPNKLEYYEGTKDPNWRKNIIDEYKANKKIELPISQRLIVGNALRYSKNEPELLFGFLPTLLRVGNREDNIALLRDMSSCNIIFNEDVIKSLIELRYSDLQDWERPAVKYVDAEAKLLFDAIDDVKKMRSENSIDLLIRSLKAMKVRDYCDRNYKRYSRKSVGIIVYTELGKIFEEKGRFVDALAYYEWAQKQSDDKSYQLAMQKRWVQCKERQADDLIDNNDKAEEYRSEALTKREKFGISLTEKFPLKPELSIADWESLFKHYLSVSKDVSGKIEIAEEKEEPKMEENKVTVEEKVQKVPSQHSDVALSTSIQKMQIGNYSFSFNPQKGTVTIANRGDFDEEYQVRIKNGKFPEDADFVLKQGRMYVADEDIITPFEISVIEGVVSISLFDENNLFTNVTISFNTNK
ncbi:hypothetical protein [Sodaliphilus sp.]|uniref:hypothetical protein n=1 Tax=Sodaliphilus sp. TaxID=2815818 RepID=UPI00388D34CC